MHHLRDRPYRTNNHNRTDTISSVSLSETDVESGFASSSPNIRMTTSLGSTRMNMSDNALPLPLPPPLPLAGAASSSSLDLGRPSPPYANQGHYGRSASSSSVNITRTAETHGGAAQPIYTSGQAEMVLNSSRPNGAGGQSVDLDINGLGLGNATGSSASISASGGGAIRSLRTQYPSNRSLARIPQTPSRTAPGGGAGQAGQRSQSRNGSGGSATGGGGGGGGGGSHGFGRYHRQANPSMSSISGVSDTGESQFGLDEMA
jgi:hypothetical protein